MWHGLMAQLKDIQKEEQDLSLTQKKSKLGRVVNNI